MFRRPFFVLAAFCTVLGGCHHVVLDPIPPVSTERLPVSAQFEIDPFSASYTFSMRSFAAGIANKWTIHVGDALTQYAQSYLNEAFAPGNGLAIAVKIENFDVEDFSARATLRFIVRRDAEERFNKVYLGVGKSYFGRTAMTGVFGMNGSMSKTTDEALRSVFEQFLVDARSRAAQW